MGQSCFKQSQVAPDQQNRVILVGCAQTPRANPRLTISIPPPVSNKFMQSPLTPFEWSWQDTQISIASRENPTSIGILGVQKDDNEYSLSVIDAGECSYGLKTEACRSLSPEYFLSTPVTRHSVSLQSMVSPVSGLNFSERRFYNLCVLLLKTQCDGNRDEIDYITNHNFIDKIAESIDPDRVIFLKAQAQISHEMTSKLKSN